MIFHISSMSYHMHIVFVLTKKPLVPGNRVNLHIEGVMA